VSKRPSGSPPKGAPAATGPVRFALDPYFAYLLFVGVGLGTLPLSPTPRLIMLWMTLLGLWLVYREGQPVHVTYRFSEIARGVLVGLGIGAPLVIITFRGLAQAIPILYVGQAAADSVTGSTVFTSLVVLAPLAEELFFRDVLQRERGPWIATAMYAAVGLIFFLPTAGAFPIVLLSVSGAVGILGILYAFLHARYGLTAAIACHATVNLILLCVPATLSHLQLFTR
jgi:membrane protease YdiL (CAAX protease family)